jgi:hypothetical protein
MTLVELLQALKKLQRNKVVGLDGMKAEFILDAKDILHMPLLTMFNCFLAKGFLETLSIGPILAKLFAMILDKRLNECAEQHGLCAKGQTGFCKDYCTANQLFILRTLIEHNKAKKKPLYFYFVDFKKVFDIMPCEVLWQVLASLGVEGHFV